VGLIPSTSVISTEEKMSAEPCHEATPTDYDSFWNETAEQSGGLTQPSDPAVRPNYYKRGGLECYDVIRKTMGEEKYKGFLWGNIQKYLWRWEQKNGKQDLKKALEYLGKLLETLE
jgi:cephalosporin-C deacetylase-like acetyl esterase